MKRKDYTKPEVVVVNLKMGHALLAGSINESTDSAAEMGTGSFGARGTGSLWDDDDDEEY